MDIKTIIGKSQERRFQLDSIRSINEKERTVEVAFSSEAMVPMWYGMESLSHDTGAVDLSRILDGGPVLMDHDEVRWVGAVQSARIDQDRKGRAVLKFGENSLAKDVWPDIASGLRKLVSFRYRVLDAIPANTEDGAEYIKVTRWQPLEISFVSVPADASVGVGRSLQQSQHNNSMPGNNTQESGGQTANKQAPANDNQAQTEQRSAPTQSKQEAPQEQPPQRDLSANVIVSGGETQKRGVNPEHAQIRALAEKHGALKEGLDFIVNGRSLSDFKDLLLERGAKADASHKTGPSVLGLSDNEQRKYSFTRAMLAVAFPHDKDIQEWASFERECSADVQKRWGQTGEFSITIPTEILASQQLFRSLHPQGQRAFNLSAGAGAINEGLRPQDFVELLRNKTLAYQLGVGFVPDVIGSPEIPRQTASGTAGWITEDATATTTDAAITKAQISPKHISATTYVTRAMRIQDSIGMEARNINNLYQNLAVGIDKAVFHGTGSSGQPTGLSAASIGSVAIGTNGGNMTKAKLHEFLSDVEIANAMFENTAFVTTPGVKSFLMQTLMDSGIAGNMWNMQGNTVLGHRAFATNQISSTLTKGSSSGVCHAMFFGDFSQITVFGWGPLEFIRDDKSSAVKGGINLVALQSVDLFIDQLGAFSACLDITV